MCWSRTSTVFQKVQKIRNLYFWIFRFFFLYEYKKYTYWWKMPTKSTDIFGVYNLRYSVERSMKIWCTFPSCLKKPPHFRPQILVVASPLLFGKISHPLFVALVVSFFFLLFFLPVSYFIYFQPFPKPLVFCGGKPFSTRRTLSIWNFHAVNIWLALLCPDVVDFFSLHGLRVRNLF